MNKEIDKTKEQLDSELNELRKKSKREKEELKAANQQLEANNQQLQATEQQLRAVNQQLNASNQQLIASEQELKKEKIFSEKIAETADAIIVGLDKDHIIRIFNRGAEHITGYKKEEVIGKDWFKIFSPKEMLGEMNKVWKKAWGVKSYSNINPILAKSGEERIISWQNTGMYDSDDVSKHLLLSIGEDITERKQAEEAMRESETRYKNLASMMRLMCDNLPELIWTKDMEGKFLFVNKACSEILLDAKDTAEPIGKTDMYFAQRGINSHPENPDYFTFGKACTDSDLAVLDTKKPLRFDESGNVKNKFLCLDVYKAPFTDENGNIIGTVGCAVVVTKERQMEKELKESEAKFRDMANLMPQIVYEIDLKGNLTFVNQQAFETFGYSIDDFEKGFNLMQALLPEDRDKANENIQNVINGKNVGSQEYIALRKDGSTLPVLIHSSLILKDNKPAGLRGIIVDITERKQAEDALRESEENYRSVVENSHNGILIVGEDYRFIYVNDMFCRIVGYPRDEIIGQDFTKFIDEESKKLVADRYKRRQAGEKLPPRYEFNVVRKDGTKRRVEISSAISKDSKGRARTIAQILDITERKQAEEALKESEENFQQVVSNITTVVWKADIGKNGAFENTYSSPVLDELLELPAGTMKNDWDKYFSYIKPEYLEQVNNAFKEAIKSPGKKIDCEYEILKDNGQTVWVNSKGRCFEKDGKLHVFGSTTDITERKQAEEALQKSEERFKRLFSMMRLMSDNLPDLIWAKDIEGKFTFVNESCAKILLDAKNTDEPIGKTDMYFAQKGKSSNPEDPDYFTFGELCTDSDQAVIDNDKPLRFDESGNVKGEFLFLDVYKAPFKNENGDIIGTVGSARIVTKERQIEAELSESEEKYRLLADNSMDVIWKMDLKLVFTYTSPSVKNIMGFTVDEWVGTRLSQHTNTKEFFNMAKKALNAIKHYKEYKHLAFNTVMLHKDGTEIPVEITTKLIFGKKGLPIGLQGTTRDITERKKAEGELKKRMTELEIFNDAAVDRELKIIEHRKEINELLKKLGKDEKYEIVT